ncbi:MAG: hypothetical protein U1F42_08835 [Candidatus Competibacteraceae bacterium]
MPRITLEFTDRHRSSTNLPTAKKLMRWSGRRALALYSYVFAARNRGEEAEAHMLDEWSKVLKTIVFD